MVEHLAVGSIKAAAQDGVEETNRAAGEGPGSILQNAEKVTVSVGDDWGNAVLDASAHREAKTRLAGGAKEVKATCGSDKMLHTNDVRAAQSHAQSSDTVMAECACGLASGSTSRGGNWISKAVAMAKDHRKRLSRAHRVSVSELAMVNV